MTGLVAGMGVASCIVTLRYTEGHSMFTFAAGLKRGMCVIVEGRPCVVVYSSHVKYGKGPVFVHVELRDAVSGAPCKARFRLMEQVEKRELVTRWMRYRQGSGDGFVFLDSETGERVDVPGDLIGDEVRGLKEGNLWKFVYLDGELFAATLLFRG